MKNYNFLFIIFLGIILTNCGNTKNGENSIFTFDNSNYKAHYVSEDALSLGILNPNSKEIDSIVYYVNDKKVGSIKGNQKLSFIGHLNQESEGINLISRANTKIALKARGWDAIRE